MSNKYRKKPVVIEAFQMTFERRMDNSEWPQWLHEAWNKEPSEKGAFFCKRVDGTDCATVYCKTLEGEHEVTWNDFIIQGVEGEIYPCKPLIFEKTYEAVNDKET